MKQKSSIAADPSYLESNDASARTLRYKLSSLVQNDILSSI